MLVKTELRNKRKNDKVIVLYHYKRAKKVVLYFEDNFLSYESTKRIHKSKLNVVGCWKIKKQN
tara:strand:- start:152 stop:340 length:189 start_codon:yes stop_codon:yes gene_type:complete